MSEERKEVFKKKKKRHYLEKKHPQNVSEELKNAPEAAVWWRRGQKNRSCMWLSPHLPEAHVGKHCCSARKVCPQAYPMQINNSAGSQ